MILEKRRLGGKRTIPWKLLIKSANIHLDNSHGLLANKIECFQNMLSFGFCYFQYYIATIGLSSPKCRAMSQYYSIPILEDQWKI